jgi:hypothetical protein
VKLTSASGTSYVCNGIDGADGSPWAVGGVLPAGSTETGTWGGATSGAGFFPVSIPVPLEETPNPILVKPGEENVTGCPGLDSGGKPQAAAGVLCLYASALVGTVEQVGFFDPTKQFVPGAAPSGTVLGYECATASCITYGTWAVTAE